MEEMIKDIFMRLGADICGIANVERFSEAPSGFHPMDIYEDCKSVIVFVKCLPKGLAYVSPRIVYNKAKDTAVSELDRISFLASRELEKLGAIGVPVPSDSPYDYWESDKLLGKGLLSMKHAAVLAGIGTMGKNTLLMNRKYGNMMEIGAVLTNLALKSDPLAEKVCLDSCRLCIDNCPSKALDGISANQKHCREYTYSTNERGFSVCKCNKCMLICPRSMGER